MPYFYKNKADEVAILPTDKCKSFLLGASIILGVVRHAQIIQNNKFAISLQYLKKKVSNELDLLQAQKHESFMQTDAMVFDEDSQASPMFPK